MTPDDELCMLRFFHLLLKIDRRNRKQESDEQEAQIIEDAVEQNTDCADDD